MIQNAKFLGYCFYININIQGDFQICISAPLIQFFLSMWYSQFFHEHSRFTRQDNRGRGRLSIKLLSTTSSRFTDTQPLTGRLLKRAHLYTQLAAGLEQGTFKYKQVKAKTASANLYLHLHVSIWIFCTMSISFVLDGLLLSIYFECFV